jgi:KDO2-lipid IV(A) lauroyltransferase
MVARLGRTWVAFVTGWMRGIAKWPSRISRVLRPGKVHGTNSLPRPGDFRRIGEIRVRGENRVLEFEQFQRHVEVTGTDEWLSRDFNQAPQSRIVPSDTSAISKPSRGWASSFRNSVAPPPTATCGARAGPPHEIVARAIRLPLLRAPDRGGALRAAIKRLLGPFADQHAGDGGLRLPFLGRLLHQRGPGDFRFALRRPLHLAICYRVGLAQWRLEFGEEIQTRRNGKARSVEDIYADINRAFEKAIRRDPANWFWVHNRWKPARLKPRRNRHFAEAGVGSAIDE